MKNAVNSGPMDRALSFLQLDGSALRTKVWIPAVVKILGNQNYPLHEEVSEVFIEMVAGGFKTQFKKPFRIAAEKLIGNSSDYAVIRDVEIHLPALVLSTAMMNPGSFPRTVHKGEIVGIFK